MCALMLCLGVSGIPTIGFKGGLVTGLAAASGAGLAPRSPAVFGGSLGRWLHLPGCHGGDEALDAGAEHSVRGWTFGAHIGGMQL